MRWSWWRLAVLAGLVAGGPACSEDGGVATDAGAPPDTSSSDLVASDASAPMSDDGTKPDGGPAPTDDGTKPDVAPGDIPPACVDGDSDGVLGRSASCPQGKDCNDGDGTIFPGAPEVCGDQIDQDCSGADLPCCVDGDSDGYGQGSGCDKPGLDCNDADPTVNPGATELCGNGVDDDCSGGDEACPPAQCEPASDTDSDGFGTGPGCDPVDCADGNAAIFPGAAEVCGDQIDQDCDGVDLACPAVDCVDNDGDGYGAGTECANPGGDCNDLDPSVNAGATEVCGDQVDQDCVDGDLECPATCVDMDMDMAFAIAADCPEGNDCDDGDASAHPGAEEVCGDTIDQDCTGADLVCPATDCTSDDSCGGGQWCNTATGDCFVVKAWDYWAPVVYVDVSASNPQFDTFTSLDFDGNAFAGDNAMHVGGSPLNAAAYYSFTKTDTHWYLGYHYYFPRRWSIFGATFGIEYDNAMRSVLLVVRQNGGYGELELMLTTTENGIRSYLPDGSDLVPALGGAGGEIVFEAGGGGSVRPVVFIKDETHDIVGDADWHVDGFPGGDGAIYRYGYVAEPPQGGVDELTYTLSSLRDAVWSQRNDSSAQGYFGDFGRFTGDDDYGLSRAPWAYPDDTSPVPPAPYGELLYDPATLVRRHFGSGWGTFATIYTYNPYAVRVDVDWLYVDADLDPLFGQGGSDPYLNLYLSDGLGNRVRVLGEASGVQGFWQASDVPEDGQLFDMHAELGRFWFYGLLYPGQPHFAVEVRDDDGVGDDWLMDPAQRFETSDTSGLSVFYDFVLSDMNLRVTLP